MVCIGRYHGCGSRISDWHHLTVTDQETHLRSTVSNTQSKMQSVLHCNSSNSMCASTALQVACMSGRSSTPVLRHAHLLAQPTAKPALCFGLFAALLAETGTSFGYTINTCCVELAPSTPAPWDAMGTCPVPCEYRRDTYGPRCRGRVCELLAQGPWEADCRT